jgi:hypothetical protein
VSALGTPQRSVADYVQGLVWAEFARSISVPLSDLTLAQGAASVTLGSFDTFAAHCIYDRFGDLGSNCMKFAPDRESYENKVIAVVQISGAALKRWSRVSSPSFHAVYDSINRYC